MKFKIEYLFPLLASGSNWFRLCIYIWLIFTAIMFIWGGRIYYSRNMEKAIVEYQTQYTKIERLLDDINEYIENIKKKHKKEIDSIAQQFNVRGMLHSGGHVESQYELVNKNQRTINAEWKLIDRKIQDQLISLGVNEIKDNDIQHKYDEVMEKKDLVNKEIMSLTENWLEKRNWLMDRKTAEAVKGQVFKE